MKSAYSILRNYIVYIIKYVLFMSGMITLFEKLFKIKPGIIILFYHQLSGIDEKDIHPDSIKLDIFKTHMKYLNKKYKFITLNEAINMLKNKCVLDRDYMVITFDDGYKNILDYWDNELQNLDIKPTIYITAGHIDKKTPIWTDKIDYIIKESLNTSQLDVLIEKEKCSFSLSSYKDRIKTSELLKNEIKKLDSELIKQKVEMLGEILDMDPASTDFKLLDWTCVKKLKELGFDIGSHTLEHFNLGNMSTDVRLNEIRKSYQLIYEKAGMRIQNFAYPFGYPEHYNSETIKYVKEIYNSAVTVNTGINYPEDNVFELKRICGGREKVHTLACRIFREKLKSVFLSKEKQKVQI